MKLATLYVIHIMCWGCVGGLPGPEKGDACRCHIALTAAADLLDPDMFMSGTSGFRCWGKMGRAGCCWRGWNEDFERKRCPELL